VKKTILYVQFILRNFDKREVQRVFEHCANAIHHVQELFSFWPKRCTAIQPCCSCIILLMQQR